MLKLNYTSRIQYYVTYA